MIRVFTRRIVARVCFRQGNDKMIAEKWVIRVNTTKFFTGLKRRNVYRAAVAYGGVILGSNPSGVAT